MPGMRPGRRGRRAGREPAGSRRATVRLLFSCVTMAAVDGSAQAPLAAGPSVRLAQKGVYLPAPRRYAFPMSGEYQLMLMVAVMHLLGLIGVGVLMYMALRNDSGHRRQGESGQDDGWGNEPR